MIPNILTTVRLALIPFFAYFMVGQNNFYIASTIFILSGITDVVDGYIARHYNMISNFGKVYDPLVDKLMQITAIVCLVIEKIIPIGLLVFVLIKEITMIVIGGILYIRKVVVSSNWSGKVSTVVFYAGVLILLFWSNIPDIAEFIVFGVMVLAMLIAAFCYLIDTAKNYKNNIIVK